MLMTESFWISSKSTSKVWSSAFAKEGYLAMSEPTAILSQMIVDEVRWRGRGVDVGRVVFDVLVREGIDTTTEPTAAELKPILVAAYRAARQEFCHAHS